MTQDAPTYDPHPPFRRLLVTVDITTGSLVPLDDLAALAARLEAEILGLCVEDTDFLNLTGYRVVTRFPQRGHVVLDAESVERAIRRHLATTRRAIEAAAGRVRVPVTFETRRGRTAYECVRSAGQGDLIVVSRQAGSLVGTGGSAPSSTGRIARDVIREARHPVFVLGRAGSLEGPLYVMFDGTASSVRALEFATAIAVRWEHRALVVFLLIDATRSAQDLRGQADRVVSRVAVPSAYEVVRGDPINALSDALSAHPEEGVLVLGAEQELVKNDLDEVLERIGCSVLLLR